MDGLKQQYWVLCDADYRKKNKSSEETELNSDPLKTTENPLLFLIEEELECRS